MKRIPGSISRRKFMRGALLTMAGAVLAACQRGPVKAAPTARAQPGSTSTPGASVTPSDPIYLDTSRSIAERVDDLVSRMSIDEKIAQMGSEAPAIEQLNIPQYNWWNEALHGVGRAGIATVFPQVIGLASTWNPELIFRIADAISEEGRAKHHQAVREGVRDLYTGLTFFCPNVNIFRDPRWGRGQETYGEDPYLTSRLAVQFIKGMQGDDERYFKTVATPKHFAVHSGPEKKRHFFDAQVSQSDLLMTYLPAFKACIMEGKAYSIMGAYNRVNGEASCASPTLLQKFLRGEWGFEGYVVSDCGAVDDIFSGHGLVKSMAEAAALAVKTGCDLECGCTYGIACDYNQLDEAVKKGFLSEADLDRSVKRLFMARFRLGMFDPDEQVPYAQIPASVVDAPDKRALALEAARQSLVLLKNENNLLPLAMDKPSSIAVIGPNADNLLALTGNYMGTPAEPISVVEGIRRLVGAVVQVNYVQGCEISGLSEDGFGDAVQAAKKSQAVVMVMGLSQQLEGEQGQREGNPPWITSLGDRLTLDLPPIQQKLLEAVQATGTPLILVLLNGSAVAVNWASEHVPAVLEAWYPGQAGGTAVAEAIFGLTNPGGRLPVTFYKSVSDLPNFEDYSMANRTYRYFSGQPLYGFGFGLSYTTFAYDNLLVDPAQVKAGQPVSVSVDVTNSGAREGDEVIQLYLQDVDASQPVPRLALQGFTRLRLAPGEKQTVQFTLTTEQMSFADQNGQWLLEPGDFKLWVGGQQPDLKAAERPANVLEGQFSVQS